MEIHERSALDIARAVASRERSCVEVVQATFSRIEKLNPLVNAVVWVRERALDDARAADERLARGDPARALEGVPFTVKELCATADGPSELGSRAFAGHSYGVDALVVRELKAAGAILVGTTASSEFGNRPTTESDLHGATRNPWDLERTSGGSSGGAGVSAALAFAPLNQASDGGGSIRIPSSCCGVFGLKTARGRISLGPVMGEAWGGLDVYGPVTRSVADAAAFLDATAAPVSGDPTWAPLPDRSFLSATEEEPRLRIAVSFERDGERIDPETIDAVRATAALLEELGHAVEEAAPSLLPLEEAFLTVSTVGIGSVELTDEQLGLLEPRTRLIVEVARQVRAVDYQLALDRMHRATREIMPFFGGYDVLLTPTLSRPAPPIGEIGASIETAWDDYRNWLCWTWPFNCTGQPAASVPAAWSGAGLPIGVQVVGRPAAERTVLAVAAQLERARPWAQHHPPLW